MPWENNKSESNAPHLKPVFADVCDDDLGCSEGFGGHHVDEADGSGAAHQNSFAQLHFTPPTGMHPHRCRFTAITSTLFNINGT